MLSVLDNVREVIGMDSNYFYTCCVAFVATIIIPVVAGIGKIVQNIRNTNVWDLCCRIEGDLFYPLVMLFEFFLSFLVFLIMVIFQAVLIKFEMNYCVSFIVMLCLMLFLTVISMAFTLRRIFIRKRIIGNKKEKYLVLAPGVIYNILFFAMVLYMYMILCLDLSIVLFVVLFVAIAVSEILGMYVFGGRYIEYEYSSVIFYLNDKSVIDCKDITSVIKKYNSFIIKEDEKKITIKFDNISRVEYYGGKKIILIGENRKK